MVVMSRGMPPERLKINSTACGVKRFLYLDDDGDAADDDDDEEEEDDDDDEEEEEEEEEEV
jgi:predicted small lipoprotein YifL